MGMAASGSITVPKGAVDRWAVSGIGRFSEYQYPRNLAHNSRTGFEIDVVPTSGQPTIRKFTASQCKRVYRDRSEALLSDQVLH
jgi:hypothetical protein